jgi:hypothetical protein
MYRKLFTLLITIFILSASWVSVRAQTQTTDTKFFNETGHNIRGEFLQFYNSNPNAIIIYGYPITEEFTNRDGKKIQYFQRTRFEYRAELPAGQRVQLSLLGRETYTSTGPLNVNNAFACRTYSETGFAVCFSFLEFFDKYGGVAQFGYPISAFEYHENKLVQYFEKARLEWQPWKPEGQRVVVSDLGRIYFDQIREDPGLLTAVKPQDIIANPLNSIQVRAFVWKAVTLATDSQLIYIIVQDQTLQPVANSKCTAFVHWKDGRTDSNTISTNTNGIGLMALSFSNQPYGSLVYIDISCTLNDLKANTTTSFRVWY